MQGGGVKEKIVVERNPLFTPLLHKQLWVNYWQERQALGGDRLTKFRCVSTVTRVFRHVTN